MLVTVAICLVDELLTGQFTLRNMIILKLQEWTIDMTGQVTPAKRESLWKTKRVFFVTPQVLEKDIQSGNSLTSNFIYML